MTSKVNIKWLEPAVYEIQRRTRLLDDPVEALTLKTLINIRLKDIAKIRKYLQKTESLTDDVANQTVEFEGQLASALTRCTLYLDNPVWFKKYC